MPQPTALARLLHLRTLEEEQRRAALDAVMAELHRLQAALQSARACERRGREAMPHASQSADRIAALVECEASRRAAAVLHPRIAAARLQTAELRRLYLEKRTERRQLETLLRQFQAREALDLSRREQQAVDNWFGVRRHASAARPASRPVPAEPESQNARDSPSSPHSEPPSHL